MDYEKLGGDRLTEQQLLEGTKEYVLESLKPHNLRIIKERVVTIDGHPGSFLHAEHGVRGVIRLEWVAVGKKVYLLIAEGRKGIPNELEGKDDFEKVAMGFINSFRLDQ
jgi:hypothetical protein